MEDFQFGMQKIDKRAMSNFRKITVPMTRNFPGLTVHEIMSVQPMTGSTGKISTMGLGPPVCTLCMILGTLNNQDKGHPWRCHNCGDFKLPGHLFSYTEDLQEYIRNRSKLYKERKIIKTTKELPYTVVKSFMFVGDDRDPNERYRTWLEENVGEQGINWNWDIKSVTANLLDVSFDQESDAVLFRLSCQ